MRNWSDARHFQILALSSLLAVNLVWFDFGAKPAYCALGIASALATQIACSRWWRLRTSTCARRSSPGCR